MQAKFFLFHLLFFHLGIMAAGPIAVLGSVGVVYNMYILPSKGEGGGTAIMVSVVQHMVVTGVQAAYVSFFVLEREWVTFEHLIILLKIIVVRSFVISVRYAYASPFRLRQL